MQHGEGEHGESGANEERNGMEEEQHTRPHCLDSLPSTFARSPPPALLLLPPLHPQREQNDLVKI